MSRFLGHQLDSFYEILHLRVRRGEDVMGFNYGQIDKNGRRTTA